MTLLFSALMFIVQLSLQAQDVTDTYLSNADFVANVTGLDEDRTIYDVSDWTEVPATADPNEI